MNFKIFCLFICLNLVASKLSAIDSLRINHLRAPLGIDITENNFSFKSTEEGPFKAKILLGDSLIEEKEIKLENSHSFTFGKPLEYNQTYKYVVESQTNKGELEFETSIKLNNTFIKPKYKNIFSPIFFKEFNLNKPTSIKKARLYITGLGLYRAFINNERVGNFYLSPGYNDYDIYLRYQTYDITQLLRGNNLIEVHMGDGWYKGRFGFFKSEIFGNEYKLNAHILIEFEDGEIQEILTDETWKVKHSQEISNGIYDGEVIDFTYENKTEEEVIISQENYNLVPDFGSPMVEKEILNPVLYISPKGEKILDFKQNMVGFIRFKGHLNKNQEITINHGEVLQDKCFYNLNYRSARPILKYKGDGNDRIYEPKFTYFGFRYALIEGLDNVDPNDFEGIVIYTDLDKTLECETDNKKINQLISNTFWGQRGNFLDVPTDCPQRDERLGWTADSQVFTSSACYNMDAYTFYKKFIKDLRGDQITYYEGDIPEYSPSLKRQARAGIAVWSDSGTIIPWNVYMHYGDKVLLRYSYQMMKDYVEVLINRDISQGNKTLILDGFCYCDWLALDGITETSTMGGTDTGFIMSVYYYNSVNILTMAAKELGEDDDYIYYTEHKNKIYNAILDEFFAPNGRLTVNTQTAYILSLHYNIYRNKDVIINGFIEKLRLDSYRLKTGFTGTPLILLTLFDNGLDAQAYRFLYNQKFPGWIYTINLGATTIWERWNSLLPNGTISGISMNSFNHYAYGSVCESIYSRIVGLKNLSPGWKKVLIQPHLNYRLKQIKFSYDSVSGKYDISWKYDEFKFYMNVSIPNGVEALIILPNNTQYNVTTQGEYKYECDIVANIIAPFSVDTPIFEILENEDATKVLRTIVPSIYDSSMGETSDTLYDTVRRFSHLNGISQETVDRCQEELSKVKVLNYTSPDEDIPTDIPTDTPTDIPTDTPTDTPTDKPTDTTTDEDHGGDNNSTSIIFNVLLFGLIIILIYF